MFCAGGPLFSQTSEDHLQVRVALCPRTEHPPAGIFPAGAICGVKSDSHFGSWTGRVQTSVYPAATTNPLFLGSSQAQNSYRRPSSASMSKMQCAALHLFAVITCTVFAKPTPISPLLSPSHHWRSVQNQRRHHPSLEGSNSLQSFDC